MGSLSFKKCASWGLPILGAPKVWSYFTLLWVNCSSSAVNVAIAPPKLCPITKISASGSIANNLALVDKTLFYIDLKASKNPKCTWHSLHLA